MLIPNIPNDFEFSDDDINEEASISLIQKEKLKILDIIIEKANKTKENIELNLPDEEEKSFRIISSYVSAIIELNSLKEELDDDATYEKIVEIRERTNEVSFSDLLNYKEDEENFNPGSLLIKNNNEENNNEKDKDSKDGSLDF